MPVSVTRTRLRVLVVCVLALFALFAGRLFQIQAVDAKAYAAMAVEAGTRKAVVPAPRGDIVDRNGEELVTSTQGLTITGDPSMAADKAPEIARILHEKLGDEIDYFDTIRKLRTPKSRFVYLAKDLPAYEARKAVQAVAEAGYPGVFTQTKSLRSYPGGSLAANVLGITEENGKGIAGLEAQYDGELTGTDGSSTYEVSSTGQRIPMADSTVKEMIPGSDVNTTLDRDLQWYADQRLRDVVSSAGADYGLAVTMDVRTCQIVQLSQAPTYNPDTRVGVNDATLVNRAVSNVFEPGSVMKTITMAALADQGKVAADTKIKVPSGMVVDGFPIGDYWQHGTLRLTAAGVIAKSSNLGTIVAAEQMSDSTFYSYLRKFGFGSRSGIDLPEESVGIVSPVREWTKAKKATTSFGQGVSVNAIQMVRAVGAIANGGVMCTPRVVDSVTKADGSVEKTPAGESQRVVSRGAAAEVTRMMEAVTADDGTAPAAQIEGYRVAGKTGTAWRVNPTTGRYVRGQNTISFMGFAPADNPRFITYVVIDKPPANAGGGSMAGPVFQDIMSMALERFGVAPTGAKPPKIKQDW
ncbi:penicillin-binding protein 2 [Aeromicrobium sp. 636]|uniref:Penicillin-binding protein 2 n=1 Tax=Aeromicrobium senzhongii TaxID=2663859 RepID=A0A8I0ESY8_9ACTN|nr:MULTISPECIES: penicillin-binding protein 2 [Aeromicrobium]MBC9225449.1 penicillin-binding protein 2 [Aeromicrobium senzhongii]MCQ3997559.1 penicillin-binding protein 2 [Aeromicrobium sp. 636]MTB87485.1 penicillin-binding protein 2 [Aeromicrobium senzhongii]QNL95468.1 penicillin-binding protein 2 [Aeromicrobium senzhongii]